MNPILEGSNRRLFAAVAGVVATVGNKKLGLDLEPDAIMELLLFLATYITASNAKAIADARAKGQAAAATVVTPADAVAVLAEPKP